jgi:hypothetical protein
MSERTRPARPRSGPRSLPPRALALAALLLAPAALAGCAAAAAAPAGAPVADPAAAAASLVRATTPPRPQRVTFTWTLNEGGSRVSGRGVVRVEAPERIRLDLFGPRNETYLAAALVGDMYRMPATVTAQVALPSPAILWGGLGVIRPPAGAQLLGAVSTDSSSALRYRAQDATVYQYETVGGAASPRLSMVERSGSGGRLETVRLTRDAAGKLTRAEYRNWAAFRELTLDFQEAQDVASFPADTWQP